MNNENQVTNASEITNSPTPILDSPLKILRWTFNFFRAHLKTIWGISLVPLILGAAPIFFKQDLLTNLIWASVGIAIISIANLISRMALFYAVTQEGKTNTGESYKQGVKKIIPFAWVGVLSLIIGFGGAFLLFIPVILFSIWLSLSTYTFFAEDRRGLSALVASWHYVRGYWWPVLWRFIFLGLVFLPFVLIMFLLSSGPVFLSVFQGTLPQGIGISVKARVLILLLNNLIMVPLGTIYTYGIYQALKKIKGQAPAELNEPKLRKWLKTFLILGIILIILIISALALFALSPRIY